MSVRGLPDAGSTGGAYNQVFIEDCELTGNRATLYGAGVALSALRSYLDREKVGEVYFRDKWVGCEHVWRGGCFVCVSVCLCVCVSVFCIGPTRQLPPSRCNYCAIDCAIIAM